MGTGKSLLFSAKNSVADSALDFPTLYRDWFAEVVRWARASGVERQDLEDVAQEVFVTVRHKLPAFDGDNLAGWLYTITTHIARNHRRKVWLRRLFFRDHESSQVEQLQARCPSPVELLERKEMRALLHALLAKMSDKRRRAFVLFEIDGLSGEEIAALERIPLSTAWARLHQARKDFVALADDLRQGGG